MRSFDDFREIITASEPLAPHTWFRLGGPAQVLARPRTVDQLVGLLRRCRDGEVPWKILAGGSNVLVRDQGVAGLVIHLESPAFADIRVEGRQIEAGAAVPLTALISQTARAGLAGLETLTGIPGTVGGALRMNGGAYGGETKDVLVEARGLTRSGEAVTYSNRQMEFTYRHAGVPEDVIFTEAVFEGRPGNPEEILAEMNAITEARSSTQPVNTRTGGSTFKNPPGHKAWQLVDAAGCRGLRVGEAQVSEMHCNFLINHGSASAAEIEGLGEEVRRRVREASGIELEWEIKRVGLARA
jgi:UDP-N-acetylmuramate dehydrogenase